MYNATWLRVTLALTMLVALAGACICSSEPPSG